MYQSVLWYENPCECTHCKQLRTSFDEVFAVVREGDQGKASFAEICRAAAKVGEAAEMLHKEHRPGLYPEMAMLILTQRGEEEQQTEATQTAATEKAKNAGVSRNEWETQNWRETKTERGAKNDGRKNNDGEKKKKSEPRRFIVCDHCMAHGLRCDEASVCKPCQYYNQPCIHRWCKDSRDDIDECPDPSCKYVHMDSIPHTPNEPHWVIFRGQLPEHKSLPKLYTDLRQMTVTSDHVEIMNDRQKAGVRRYGGSGKGNTAAFLKHLKCDCAGTV